MYDEAVQELNKEKTEEVKNRLPSESRINDKAMTPKERITRYFRRDKAFFAGVKP